MDSPPFFGGEPQPDKNVGVPRLKVHTATRKRIAANLVRMMAQSRMSMRALSIASGVRRSGLYRIRGASSGATVDVLGRLADAMDLDVARFLRKVRR